MMNWNRILDMIRQMGYVVINDFNPYESEIILHCVEKEEEE